MSGGWLSGFWGSTPSPPPSPTQSESNTFTSSLLDSESSPPSLESTPLPPPSSTYTAASSCYGLDDQVDNNTTTEQEEKKTSSQTLPSNPLKEEKEIKKESKKETKKENPPSSTIPPRWFPSASKWRQILVGDRTDVSLSEEELFIVLGHLTVTLEDHGRLLTSKVLDERRAEVLFEGSDMSDIILLSLQLITERLSASAFLDLRVKLLQDLSIFLTTTVTIISRMNLPNETTPKRDHELEKQVCRKVRSHPALARMWAVRHGTSSVGGNEHVFALWEHVISVLLPTDILSPNSPTEANKTVHNLAKMLFKKSRAGLSIVLGKCCADLLAAFENTDTIDLVFYRLLMVLKTALPPMSEIVSKKISEAVWGKEKKSALNNPSVVTGMDLMASRELWPQNPNFSSSNPSSSSSPSSTSSSPSSMKKVKSAGALQNPGLLIDSDVFIPFDYEEEEDPQDPQQQQFLQKREGDAINSLVVNFLFHVCGSYGAAAFLATSPFILPQEIEKELRKNDVLVHTSSGQQLNLALFLPLLHMISLKLEGIAKNASPTPSPSSPPPSPLLSSFNSSAPSSPSPNPSPAPSPSPSPSPSQRSSGSLSSSSSPSPSLPSKVEPGPASAADVDLKELWGEQDDEITRKLKVNFVENYFKDPERTDPVLAARLNAWGMVGLFQGFQRLRDWMRRFPFLLKTIFLIVLRTILDSLFPELESFK